MSSCSRNSASCRGCPKPSCVNWWITECSRRSTRTQDTGASARNALVGRQRHVVLDVVYEQVESALRVRLDQLELRKRVLERFDVVAVLNLVQTVRGPFAVSAAVVLVVILLVF